MVITRLGQGVDRTGQLDPEALAAHGRGARALTAAAPGPCTRNASAWRPRARCATRRTARSSRRRSASTRERARGDQRRAGGGPVVPRADARARSGSAPAPYLVLDIGGGSTEFVVGRRAGPRRACALDADGERSADRAVRTSRPAGARGARAAATRSRRCWMTPKRTCRSATRAPSSPWPAPRRRSRRSRSASIAYDPDAIHRTWLTLETAERVLADLVRMTTPERAALPVMAPGRGDVIVAGARDPHDRDAAVRVRAGARERDRHPGRPRLRALDIR